MTTRNTSKNSGKSNNKKTSAKRTSSGTNRTSSKSGTTSKSTRSTSKKTNVSYSGSRKKKRRNQANDIIKRDIVFYVMIILFVFVFLSLINIIKEPVGTAVKSFMLGTFGILAFIMPFIIFFGTWFIIANEVENLPIAKIVGFCIVLFFTGAFLSIISRNDIISIVDNNTYVKDLYAGKCGGGVFFGILGVWLTKFLGKTGACIISLLLIIIGIFCFARQSMLDMFSLLAKGAYSKITSSNDDDDYYDDYEDEYDDAANEVANNKPAKINKKSKKRQNFFDQSDINLSKDYSDENVEADHNDVDIDNDKLSNSGLNDSERQSFIKKSQESIKTRLEEEQRLKKEKEEEKLRIQDMKDDERILNSSIDSISNISNVTDSGFKDDVHMINIIPEAQAQNKDIISDQTNIFENNTNIHGAKMHEIYYDGLSSDEPTHDLEKLIGEDNFSNNSDSSFGAESSKDNEFSKYKELDTNDKNSHSSITDNDVNININRYCDVENDVTIDKTDNNNSNSSTVDMLDIDDGNVSLLNDTPMDLPESVVNGVSINPLEDVYSQDELLKMPNPVTERSHAKEPVKATEKDEGKIRRIVHDRNKYKFPAIKLLKKNEKTNSGDSDRELKETALKLQKTLKTFGVPVTVNDISQGPSVTRYELSLGEGIKVNKIVSLTDDIKLNLAAEDIRIEAPIPGKAAVGIEVPNKVVGSVLVRDLLESGEFKNAKSNLTFAVGKDITGKTIVEDIAKMPHLLIAGSTGSGKSVCINTLIMSLLYKAHPDDVKLIMIDPKVVELSVYNGIPHLCLPVVTEPKKASATLKWAVKEMDERYNDFSHYNVRDLKGYNEKATELINSGNTDVYVKPQIVIIVDELADLMMVASKEVEESICRLAQKARAAGIHLVIATQRPSVDVITGLIKANMPSRIAFKVSSGVDSRTILDMIGAERLLGKGDMLFYPQGYSKPQRIQGAFISDNEVASVVEELKNQNMDYVVDDEISSQIDNLGQENNQTDEGQSPSKESEFDSYFKEACQFVIEKGSASSGMLQRVYRIGFNRAARMIDQMESLGIVSSERGTKPRDILVNMAQLEEILNNIK